MVRSRDRRRAGGVTVLELMISASLLLLLTVVLGSILPAFQREEWFGNKQDETRGYLVARERLTQELKNVGLVDLGPEPVFAADGSHVLFRYTRPRGSSTSVGELSDVTYAEIVRYATQEYDVVLNPQNQLLFRTKEGSRQRLIWTLGEDAECTVDINTDQQRVDFHFKGTRREKHSDKQTWEHTIVCFLK